MTSENLVTLYAPGEADPVDYKDCGMMLRSNGTETRMSPGLTQDVLNIVRALENETVWMSSDGKEAMTALSDLLHDHL